MLSAGRPLVSAAEAVLQHQLVVPGQLPPPSERPADMEELLVPPTVILPTGHSYAQAATTSRLDGVDWVYVAKGGQAAYGGQVQRPLHDVCEENKAWKLQVGERVHVVSRDGLKPHLGSMAPEAAVPPTCGRLRTASVAPVAFTSSAEKPGGPV